jgi:hypothetical protein
MEFTFGILTSKLSENYLIDVLDSIYSQNIPKFEILLIGETNKKFTNKNITHINFDETQRKGWITKKKNIITDKARFENIVYMHDYLNLEDNWYSGFVKHGNNFQVCTNKILTKDNQRYRDWTLWQLNNTKFDQYLNRTRRCLLPYNITSLSKFMYISGAYWVAKRDFMKKNKLNENLLWGEGEDVEWSKRVRKKTTFQFNENSTTRLLKEKEVIFKNIDGLTLQMMLDYNENLINQKIDKSKIYLKKALKRNEK